MIRLESNRAVVEGAMTMAAAPSLLSEGEGVIAKAVTQFDLAEVSSLDSSGLAVIFAWVRAAQRAGLKLSLLNAPENLLTLADVYGVRDLLPAA